MKQKRFQASTIMPALRLLWNWNFGGQFLKPKFEQKNLSFCCLPNFFAAFWGKKVWRNSFKKSTPRGKFKFRNFWISFWSHCHPASPPWPWYRWLTPVGLRTTFVSWPSWHPQDRKSSPWRWIWSWALVVSWQWLYLLWRHSDFVPIFLVRVPEEEFRF